MTAVPFPTLTLEDLFALELPKMEYVVDGILPLGTLTMLAAREKAGKSLLTVDLCCSVALGESFLDRAVRQGAALLVPAEDNIREVRARIDVRLAGARYGPLHVLPVNGFFDTTLRLDDGASMERLYATIQELELSVVVLDPMRELHGLQEDKADDMGPLLRPLRQIAHDTNCAIVLNHHMNKGGTARGSTAIRAAVDQEWAFQRTDTDVLPAGSPDGGPATGTITIEGRYGPRQTLSIRLGPELRWDMAMTAIRLLGTTSAADRVIAYLQANGDGGTADQIAKALQIEKKTVQNALSQVRKEQPHLIAVVGSGRKNDPHRYQIAAPTLFSSDASDDNPFAIDGVDW